MSDTLFSFRLGNWEFGIDKTFGYWWWTNGYVYEFLGYFWLFHYQNNNYTDNYNEMGFGIMIGDKIYTD